VTVATTVIGQKASGRQFLGPPKSARTTWMAVCLAAAVAQPHNPSHTRIA